MIDDWQGSFEGLDPSRDDPSYWTRFRARTVERAAPELARRRAPMTVSEVVTSWSRTVVPVAMAAAAAAMVFLAADSLPREGEPGNASAESVLDIAFDGSPVPAVLELGGATELGLAIIAGGGF